MFSNLICKIGSFHLILINILILKAASGGQASLMKVSDNTLKSLPASSQLSKPGTTVLRVSGGVITAATTSAVTLPSNGVAQVRQNVGHVPFSGLRNYGEKGGMEYSLSLLLNQCCTLLKPKLLGVLGIFFCFL